MALTVLCCLFVYLAAIYCLPFIDIQPQIPKRLPQIRYDFSRAPLLATSAKKYKIDKLFDGQIHGAESVEADSSGNLYMAIEGGYILYARMNHSNGHTNTKQKLWLLAELNKPVSSSAKSTSTSTSTSAALGQNDGSSVRACQLDEQVYGTQLSVGGVNENGPFQSRVINSRCSKPLGIRLSRNEDYLYVVDTLRGLYQIDLKQAHDNLRRRQQLGETKQEEDKPMVRILVNFNPKTKINVALERTDNEIGRVKIEVPVAMTAMDDLVIDHGAGSNGADVIYMTDASQMWLAVNYFFDFMEARPSGLVLRYDLGSNQLSAFDNAHLSRVRMSAVSANGFEAHLQIARAMPEYQVGDNGTMGIESDNREKLKSNLTTKQRIINNRGEQLETRQLDTIDDNGLQYMGYGAPKFDSSDIFDDRPMFFPNGIELMDDRQALLIADTSNKRIIKHFIRGPRKGQTDLWTWTPNLPDNIRRGSRNSDNRETYWVVGCGKDRSTNTFLEGLISDDTMNDWPRLRKFLLRQVYFIGWILETLGQTRPFRSQYIRDYGYSIKMGLTLMDRFCEGAMILQYNRNGRIIRAIHGKDFPHDMKLLSQITEVNDFNNPKQHSLYLSSPIYDYLYRLSFTTAS